MVIYHTVQENGELAEEGITFSRAFCDTGAETFVRIALGCHSDHVIQSLVAPGGPHLVLMYRPDGESADKLSVNCVRTIASLLHTLGTADAEMNALLSGQSDTAQADDQEVNVVRVQKVTLAIDDTLLTLSEWREASKQTSFALSPSIGIVARDSYW